MEKLGQSSTKQSLLQQESLLDFSKNVRLKNTTEQKNEKKKFLLYATLLTLSLGKKIKHQVFFLALVLLV